MNVNNIEDTVEETTEVEETNLDDFSSDFFNSNPPEPEEEQEASEGEEEEEASDDVKEEEAEEEEETTEEENLATEEEEEEKPLSRSEKRIRDLNAKYREEERLRKELEARIAELERAKSDNPKNPSPEKVTDNTDDKAPTPNDVDGEGNPKYPLGEWDPNFIADQTRYLVRKEYEAIAREQQEERARQEREQQEAALMAAWNEKLQPVQERYSDFSEVAGNLVNAFSGLDEAYGTFLTQTLMDLENGPEVMYYLGNNLEEARKIVESGPNRAARALGRLDGKFDSTENEPAPVARKKTTKAPPPPKHLNKGSAVSVPEVADDTDDLDAFANKLFNTKNKRRS